MFEIKRVIDKRHIYFHNIDFNFQKPVYKFHRYQVFKLRILARHTDPLYGEVAFQAASEDGSEKCIIYCLLNEPNEVELIRYWRSVDMDAEMSWLLIQGFLLEYLCKKMYVPPRIYQLHNYS